MQYVAKRLQRPLVVLAIGTCAIATLAACGGSDGATATTPPATTAFPGFTPPSKAAVAAAPSTVTITCTPNGTTLSKPIVKTTEAGVSLVVRNTTGRQKLVGYRIAPASGAAPVLGALEPTKSTKPQVYALPTGRMDLRCGSSANTGLDDEVSLTIVDPGGFYSSVNVEKVLGCVPKQLKTPRVFADRATPSDALTLMAERLPSPGRYTVQDGPGYKAADVTQHLVLRDGKGYGVATVTVLPNLSYEPAIVAVC